METQIVKAGHVAEQGVESAPMEWWERVKLRRLVVIGDYHGAKTDFAERLGVSVQRISDIEAGRYENPSLETLQAIGRVLHIRVAQLIGEESMPEPLIVDISNTSDLPCPKPVLQLRGLPPPEEGAAQHDSAVVVGQFDHIRAELQGIQERIAVLLHAINVSAPREQHADTQGHSAGDTGKKQ